MHLVHRTGVGGSIVDRTIHARQPKLLKLPIPPIPILAPIVSPVVGGSNQNTNTGATVPSNTPPPSQPTFSPSSPPSNGGGTSPPSGSTQNAGGNGSPVPVPPVVVPGSVSGPDDDATPSGSPGDPPTTGNGAITSGANGGASSTPGSVLEGAGGVVPTPGSGNGPSASLDHASANPGAVPTASPGTGGSNTLSTGGSRSTGTDVTSSGLGAEKGHFSTAAIATIIAIFIALFLSLLVFFLRRRSRAHRNKQANKWWFARKRTSQTYGDRSSTEIFSGLRRARSSSPSTASHSSREKLFNTGPAIPPLLPTTATGLVNANSLHNPSRYNTEVPDNRFSIGSNGSNHSENSQYIFVNLRNSLQDSTPAMVQAFSPSQSFAFPKPPSNTSPTSSRLFCNDGTFAATIKRPNSDDSIFCPLSTMPPAPAVVPLINNDLPESDPFADNNAFEDPQHGALPATHKEIIRQPFQSTRQDEVTVSIGECVHVLLTFEDEWAYVVKVPAPGSSGEDVGGGSKGLIPINCFKEPA